MDSPNIDNPTLPETPLRPIERGWMHARRLSLALLLIPMAIGLTILDRDEHMRPSTDMQSLASLKPSFVQMGQMGGFDAATISAGLGVDPALVPVTVSAIGRHGLAADDEIRARDTAPRIRKPAADLPDDNLAKDPKVIHARHH